MKKFTLLTAISLFLVFSGFACKKDEGPEPATVCGMKGDLRRNLRAQVSWSESLNDWVLRIDNENNGDYDGFPLHDCSGLPEELQKNGIEIIGDLAHRISSESPNPYKLPASTEKPTVRNERDST